MLRIQWVHCEFDGRGWEILCPCVGAVLRTARTVTVHKSFNVGG